MQIKFNVFWTKNLGTLYKDNSIDTLGKEAKVDLDLKEVHNIHINFKVNDKSFTDLAHIVDVEGGLIRIPFKTDVIKLGTHELELVATMKNGDVLPSQTYKYTVDKSLENPNAVEADTNYPILIELLDLAGNKLIDMDKSIQKVNTSIENMTNDISSYKEATTNALNSDISSYKETTTKELEDNFNNYSSNTTLNINKVLDNKIVEVDNVVSAKSNELDVKFITKSNEITKTLNDEINKVNTTLTNKVNEVDRVLENKVNEVDRVLDTTVTTINAELDKKSKEVDNKVNAKIVEIDNRVNAKINEVDTSLNNKINEVNEVIEEVELSEQARKEEHLELVNELSSYSSDMNNVKDRVDVLEAKITDNEVIVDLKNKVNNHEERISISEKTIRHQGILLNALNDLDDTISIEEEGTIISLPQSDDGKIIIDELQGNTLVNYCTNGSEELTLNNEINAEGTDVILTDTVDNGKVDVVCEGNTLVNLLNLENYTLTSHYVVEDFKILSLKPSTTYTLKINCEKDQAGSINVKSYPTTSNLTSIGEVNNLNSKIVFTTLSEGDFTDCRFRFYTGHGDLKIYNVILLEGDYTNKPIPSYFEGMKSVGECEDNKIEILSNNKNLFDKNSDINFISNVGTNLNSYKEVEEDYIRFKYGSYGIGGYFTSNINKLSKGIYTLSCDCYCGSEDSSKNVIMGYRINNNDRPITSCNLNSYNTWERKSHTFTISEETDIEGLIIQCSGSSQNYKDIDFRIKNMQLERNAQSTEYIPYTLNKKEISLNEPLRGLPGGVCDKFVKQGGKWYVERNCGEIVLDGSENWIIHGSYTSGAITDRVIFKASSKLSGMYVANNLNTRMQTTVVTSGISENFNTSVLRVGDSERIYGVFMSIRLSEHNIRTIGELVTWLRETPINVVYELETPTYEEITDPQLITYLDTTHISNNSTIPCNMQVKNSGYNAIIKPSTQYTVSFDADKSGEVNIGLGGAKVTTTNNVATITTPSTLTDDTLRLCGKGIKASNVRLLEGDKTNYIPSYFEGMKSCFEDKLQDDGSYEVEIASNNINLLPKEYLHSMFKDTVKVDKDDKITVLDNSGSGSYKTLNLKYIYAEPNSKLRFHAIFPQGTTLKGIALFILNDNGQRIFSNAYIRSNDYVEFTVPSNGRFKLGVSCIYSDTSVGDFYLMLTTTDCGIRSTYVPRKSNKIQLQLNEPLRGVGDIKDRFVLKDGKLMIERNCGTREYQEGDLELDNALTDKINTVYVLNEPYYEEVPHETQKLILECFENGTLFIDTLIPPTVSVTYSANKPVVAKLNQVDNTTNINTEDIAITQMAVDFLLMSSLGEEMINFKIRGGTNMSAYFASRIIKGALKYEDVIRKYPNYKEDIDLILVSEGYSDLIIEL